MDLGPQFQRKIAAMPKPLKVALQMDPIGSVNIDADTTFASAKRRRPADTSFSTTRPTGSPFRKAG